LTPRASRQRSEQYFTSSHTFAHFFRHANGLPHVTQVLDGNSLFFRIFATPRRLSP